MGETPRGVVRAGIPGLMSLPNERGPTMDPNEALRLLRLTLKQFRVDEDPGVRKAHAEEIAEYVQALDGWLSKGGFLPSAWQPGVGEIDPDYVLDRIVPLGPPDPAHGELPEDMRPGVADEGYAAEGTVTFPPVPVAELPGELCTRCLGMLGEDTVTDDAGRGYHAHCFARWGAVSA